MCPATTRAQRGGALAFAVFTIGCATGTSAGAGDGSVDAATSLDLSAAPADLAVGDVAVADLVSRPDLIPAGDGPSAADAYAADLAGADLSGPFDFAGLPHCKLTDGAGNGVMCYAEGTCDGIQRRVQCDGATCTCLLAGRKVGSFVQGDVCPQKLDVAWVNCGF